MCASGYTLIDDEGQKICTQCPSRCRVCATGAPSVCLNCGSGSYLADDSQCTSCPSNCKTCTEKGCSVCKDFFFLNSALTCSKACSFPCGTCSDSNPKKCLSCILGYSFNKITSICQPMTIC